ncbi:MAG TPA: sugar phosphate isomerase/epimerase [Chthonomonadales bacterium]|nr:sugar phosphate isomerase/epimerase [Chthonomonadales bacterium]
MQLGFVSAILPDLGLEEVLRFAAREDFDCVELMCWPVGKAERRYAGVTHVDVGALDAAGVESVHALCAETGVGISGLGYYPNPLSPDPAESAACVEHLLKVIDGAAALGVGVVNTFIGRDPALSVDANWPRLREVWPPIVAHAERCGVRIGIENCPMLFTADEWPGGKNLAHSPAVWRRLFEDIPSAHLGLNYDPSHLVWQGMDPVRPVREFASRIVHVHAKDARVDRDRLNDAGILATPLAYHTPRLPGLGDVPWGAFVCALTDAGYDGPVCIEVEDRAYEGSLEGRQGALRQSGAYLRQFLGGLTLPVA